MDTDTLLLPSGAILSGLWALHASSAEIDQELKLLHQYARRLARLRNPIQSPLLCLPVELLEYIVDYIPHSKRGPLSLVCSSILPMVQSRMIPVLKIVDIASFCSALWLARYISNPFKITTHLVFDDRFHLENDTPCYQDVGPRMADAIWDGELSEFSLEGRSTRAFLRNNTPKLSPVFNALQTLRHLTIIDAFTAQPGRSLLFSDSGMRLLHRAQFTNVTLKSCTFDSPSKLYSILASFPVLRRLAIVNCTISLVDDLATSLVAREPLSAHSLRLQGECSLPAILPLLSPQTLQSLTCSSVLAVDKNDGAFEALIQRNNKSLTELVVLWKAYTDIITGPKMSRELGPYTILIGATYFSRSYSLTNEIQIL